MTQVFSAGAGGAGIALTNAIDGDGMQRAVLAAQPTLRHCILELTAGDVPIDAAVQRQLAITSPSRTAAQTSTP